MPRSAEPTPPQWRFAGATALGTSHADSGTPCQDSVAWWCASEPASRVVAVAALADGAGSALLAEIGSRLAVDTVVEHAQQCGQSPHSVDDGDMTIDSAWIARSCFDAARLALAAEAAERGAALGDLATTLIVAVATADDLTVAEIGDGVVAVRHAAGDVVGPLDPQRGEFANETIFITSGKQLPEVSLATFELDDIDAFGLSSDGMRLLITSNPSTGIPHAPFFDDLFEAVHGGVGPEQLAAFLEGADDRTGDDKSLVVGVVLR